MSPLNLKNPYLLAAAGVPLVLNVGAGAKTENGDNIRRATGLAAIAATALWLYTGNGIARSVALGSGASWGVMKLGVL